MSLLGISVQKGKTKERLFVQMFYSCCMRVHASLKPHVLNFKLFHVN